MTSIRVAELADLPRIVQMGCAFLQGSKYRLTYLENPEQMGRLATKLIEGANSDILILAKMGDVVGMLGIIAYDHFISGERIAGEVVYWVDPDSRGHGLRLLHAGEDWARAHEAKSIQMISPSDRVDQLYERLGYAPIERTFQKDLQ